MITPRTDWQAHDYFTLGDYARITHNLDWVAGMVGASGGNYLEWGYATVLSRNERRKIADHCAAIAEKMGWAPPVEADGGYWFDWKELNKIEQLCASIMTLDNSRLQYGAPLRQGGSLTYGGGIRG